MANQSIYNAFERMWIHIVNALSSKANTTDLANHANSKSNPHNVTLSQLGVNATASELNYVDGVTKNIQTQLDTLDSDKASNIHGIYYGICETSASTVAKVVNLKYATGFELKTGAVVFVKFTATNGASNPTLNVNGTGAKPIFRYGSTRASTGTSTTGWKAGAVQMFVYDGSGWVRDFWENTIYTLSNFSITASSTELNVLDGITATTEELNYVDGVTSPIQAQLDSKAAVQIVTWGADD